MRVAGAVVGGGSVLSHVFFLHVRAADGRDGEWCACWCSYSVWCAAGAVSRYGGAASHGGLGERGATGGKNAAGGKVEQKKLENVEEAAWRDCRYTIEGCVREKN